MKPLLTTEQKMYYVLRVASAMCFIGHGTFGILTKEIWCNYFGVFGIGHNLSFQLMPILGLVDIFFGVIILLFPLRAVIMWLMIWGLITAFLRPLSGEPFPEFIERAGNFGAPFILLLLSGSFQKGFKNPFVVINSNIQSDDKVMKTVTSCLRVIVFLVFLGHGWLNLIEKKSLIDQYISLGFTNPGKASQIIGSLEILSAFIVLIRPLKSIVLALLIWKIASELFYPNHEFFEWIERGGSYGVLLALWFALKRNRAISNNTTYNRMNFLLKNRNISRLNYSSLAMNHLQAYYKNYRK